MPLRKTHPELRQKIVQAAREAAATLNPSLQDAIMAEIPLELKQQAHETWVRAYYLELERSGKLPT